MFGVSCRNVYEILGLFMVVVIVQSCEDNNIDPASYENYISVSADQYPAVSPDGTRIAYYHRCLEYPEPVFIAALLMFRGGINACPSTRLHCRLCTNARK